MKPDTRWVDNPYGFNSGAASRAQRDYLMILMNDNGIVSAAQREDWCSLRVGRTVRYLDDLTKAEASRLISELRGEDV